MAKDKMMQSASAPSASAQGAPSASAQGAPSAAELLQRWESLSGKEKHEIYQSCRAQAIREYWDLLPDSEKESRILAKRKLAHAEIGLPDPEIIGRASSKSEGGALGKLKAKYAWKPAAAKSA